MLVLRDQHEEKRPTGAEIQIAISTDSDRLADDPSQSIVTRIGRLVRVSRLTRIRSSLAMITGISCRLAGGLGTGT